jgi:type III secretion protein C
MAKSGMTKATDLSVLGAGLRKGLALCLVMMIALGNPALYAHAEPADEAGNRGAPQPSQPLPWAESPFTYVANGKTVDEVLTDFSRTFSLRLSLAARFPSRVSGKFDRRSPTEFLDRLAGVYGFQWFAHAGTLFISRTQDTVTRAIPVARLDSSGSMRRALSELRVLQDKFGYTELSKQGTVVVSGPEAYVALVEQTIIALPANTEELQVEVFRLKHASVDDRVVNYRDREIRTQGVATILRRLIGDTGGSNTGVSVVSSEGGPNSPNAATDDAARDVGAGSDTDGRQKSRSNAAKVSALRPSIQADSRTNAVIVRDSSFRMPMYRALIAQLDVPTVMVEIEALIIDVNKNKLEELGIAWYASGDKGRGTVAFGNPNSSPGSNTLSIFGGSPGSQVDMTSGSSVVLPNAGRFFVARVRALEQTGDANIQARPSVLTAENLGAILDLSETFYIETRSERVALVTPVTVGTSLRVTPRLIRDGDLSGVRLMVDIEDGKIQSQNPVGNIPTVRRGSVSTEASLALDESLLVGGYSSTQMVTGKDKVPILGDIPFIGNLFATRSQQVQSRERLFMLRARLVNGNEFLKGGDAGKPAGTDKPQGNAKPVSVTVEPVATALVVETPPPLQLSTTQAATTQAATTQAATTQPATTQPATTQAMTVQADTTQQAPPKAAVAHVPDSPPDPAPVRKAGSAPKAKLPKLVAEDGQISRRAAYRHLDAWTAAWSAGDMDQLMHYYSVRFPDRERFEARRRRAIDKSGPPRVAIKLVEGQMMGSDTIQLEFIQWYVLEGKKMRTRKFQVWQREGDSLKIIEEWAGAPKKTT